MAAKLALIVLLAIATYVVESKTVIVGEMFGLNSGNRQIFQKHVDVDAIPFIKRVQEVYYEYPNPGVLIKGIAIRDLKDGEAEPSITRGGIGFGYVNIKLKSARGSGLKYSIEVYA